MFFLSKEILFFLTMLLSCFNFLIGTRSGFRQSRHFQKFQGTYSRADEIGFFPETCEKNLRFF